MEKTIQDKAYFLSFCIEQYKNAKGLTGEEAMLELSRYGVLEYLQEFFDVLHTQSRQWLLADIDDFINKRKKKGNETISRKHSTSHITGNKKCKSSA